MREFPCQYHETVHISVIIATHNRYDSLVQTVRSLQKQTLAPSAFEIVLVENGSSEDVAEKVEKFAKSAGNIRCIRLAEAGLSNARNAGAKAACGEYVAFIDDDADASPDWLEYILHVFRIVRPKPGGVGGKIEPLWEGRRPAWLSDPLLGHISILDHSPTAGWLPEGQYFFGTNMAFQRDQLLAIGGFSSDLARKRLTLRSNEEHLVQIKLRAAGYGMYYDPQIVVRHRVSAARLRKFWILRRSWWQGVSDAMLQHVSGWRMPLAPQKRWNSMKYCWDPFLILCHVVRICGRCVGHARRRFGHSGER